MVWVLRVEKGIKLVPYKKSFLYLLPWGRLAQLVRAPVLQTGGPRFESWSAHNTLMILTI